MTIYVLDGANWRTDILPSVNVGPSWQEFDAAWKFKDGAWVQFYGKQTYNQSMGIFAGGKPTNLGADGGVITTADRCSFFTYVTATVAAAALSTARSWLGAAGCNLFGVYMAGSTHPEGGSGGVFLKLADVCTWATTTTAVQASAALTEATAGRMFVTGTGGLIGAIFAAGLNGSYVITNAACLCTWSNKTTAAQASANLSWGAEGTQSTSNQIYGVFVGGSSTMWGGAMYANADKCLWATWTSAAQGSAVMSVGRTEFFAFSNSVDKGAFIGGLAGANVIATADIIAFATLTTATQASANAPVGTCYSGACGSDSTGIYAGGYNNNDGYSPKANKLTWATLVSAVCPTANLSSRRQALGATQDGTVSS